MKDSQNVRQRFSGVGEPGLSSLASMLRLVFEESRHHHLSRTIPTVTPGAAIVRLWRRPDPEHQDLRPGRRSTRGPGGPAATLTGTRQTSVQLVEPERILRTSSNAGVENGCEESDLQISALIFNQLVSNSFVFIYNTET